MTLKMRTIDQAIKELKQEDPACALTKHALRQLILKRRVPSVMIGAKYLVSLEGLKSYLENPAPLSEPETNKIRKIV